MKVSVFSHGNVCVCIYNALFSTRKSLNLPVSKHWLLCVWLRNTGGVLRLASLFVSAIDRQQTDLWRVCCFLSVLPIVFYFFPLKFFLRQSQTPVHLNVLNSSDAICQLTGLFSVCLALYYWIIKPDSFKCLETLWQTEGKSTNPLPTVPLPARGSAFLTVRENSETHGWWFNTAFPGCPGCCLVCSWAVSHNDTHFPPRIKITWNHCFSRSMWTHPQRSPLPWRCTKDIHWRRPTWARTSSGPSPPQLETTSCSNSTNQSM